jgi:hypothetical protein
MLSDILRGNTGGGAAGGWPGGRGHRLLRKKSGQIKKRDIVTIHSLAVPFPFDIHQKTEYEICGRDIVFRDE